jgi:uncharacterized protein (TIGR03437 family)
MYRKLLLVSLLLCSALQAQVAVVNAASFATNQGVTAGSWAAAFVTVGGLTTATATTLPFPTTLGGVRLTVNGIAAPLFDVRQITAQQAQVTFLVPAGVTAGLQPVAVTAPTTSTNGTVRIVSAAPGIFEKEGPNPPKGAIINQSGIENSASLPAKKGEVISIYGTGPGAFKTAYTDGVAPGVAPLVETKSTPQVFISGVLAEVKYSGLNPSSPGLWQINVVVPNLAFITGKVPVSVFIDGVDSNQVAVFVQ